MVPPIQRTTAPKVLIRWNLIREPYSATFAEEAFRLPRPRPAPTDLTIIIRRTGFEDHTIEPSRGGGVEGGTFS